MDTKGNTEGKEEVCWGIAFSSVASCVRTRTLRKTERDRPQMTKRSKPRLQGRQAGRKARPEGSQSGLRRHPGMERKTGSLVSPPGARACQGLNDTDLATLSPGDQSTCRATARAAVATLAYDGKGEEVGNGDRTFSGHLLL